MIENKYTLKELIELQGEYEDLYTTEDFFDFLEEREKECTCGEPHISNKVEHRTDGEPCRLKPTEADIDKTPCTYPICSNISPHYHKREHGDIVMLDDKCEHGVLIHGKCAACGSKIAMGSKICEPDCLAEYPHEGCVVPATPKQLYGARPYEGDIKGATGENGESNATPKQEKAVYGCCWESKNEGEECPNHPLKQEKLELLEDDCVVFGKEINPLIEALNGLLERSLKNAENLLRHLESKDKEA